MAITYSLATLAILGTKIAITRYLVKASIYIIFDTFYFKTANLKNSNWNMHKIPR